MSIDIEARLTELLEESAARATVSDGAFAEIAARAAEVARDERRVSSGRRVAIAAAVVALAGVGVVAVEASHRTDRVRVAGSLVPPTAEVARYQLPATPDGYERSDYADAVCEAPRRDADRLACGSTWSSVSVGYLPPNQFTDGVSVMTVVGAKPSHDPRAETVEVNGHSGEYNPSDAPARLRWEPRSGEYVTVFRIGATRDELVRLAESVVRTTTIQPLFVVTNNETDPAHAAGERDALGLQGYDVPDLGMRVEPDVIPFGVRLRDGVACFSRLDILPCWPIDTARDVAVAPPEHTLGFVMGSARIDTATVDVHFADDTVERSAVNGADLGFGAGFWVVPRSEHATPTLVVAFDAQGHELAREAFAGR